MSKQFFEDIDSLKIVERHIRRAVGLEVHQAQLLVKNYIQARKDIVDRLKSVTSGTFTEAQLKTTMLQLDTIIRGLSVRVGNEINFSSENLSEQGYEDLFKEVNTFREKFQGISTDIPLSAIITSLRPENLLINQFQSSIQNYNQSLRAEIQRVLTQSVIQKKTAYQAIDEINLTMKNEEWKVARIVRTELHQIYNVSKMNGMVDIAKKTIPKLKKTLIHPMDTRTGKDSKILAKLSPIIDVGQPFKYSFRQGKKIITREFMTPPDRPNDRAILIPYAPEWDKE